MRCREEIDIPSDLRENRNTPKNSLESATIFSYTLKMPDIESICEKIRRGDSLKIKEAETILKHWGFIYRPGKGSHQNWKHPSKPKILTIAVHGKELPRYITRELKKIMEDL